MGEDDEIRDNELDAHLALAYMAWDLEDPEDRQPILADGILKYGFRFYWSLQRLVEHVGDERREPFQRLATEARDLLIAWVGGEQISDGVEEDERRAGAALDLLDQTDSMARLAAKAVARLPTGHRLRHDPRITAGLERHLSACRAAGDVEGVVGAITQLLGSAPLSTERGRELVAEALAVGGNETVEVDPRRRAVRTAMLWHFRGSVTGEDERAGYVALTHELTSQLRRLGTTPHDELAIGGALFEAAFEAAAATLGQQVDARSDVWRTAAWLEARVRVRLGEDARAIAVLESSVPLDEEDYIRAIAPSDVEASGERFTEDAVALALAYARQQRWTEALLTIERTKSPRLRHLAKLRATSAGRDLLAAEARVASLRRGVPGTHVREVDPELDPLGRHVSDELRALEELRLERPDLTSASIAPPTVAETSAALAEHEGVVSLGLDRSGLMLIGIVRGDREAPSWTELHPEITHGNAFRLFQDGDDVVSGWLLELASRSPVRPRASLERLLAKVDAALGASLAGFAAANGLRRLTVVPHRLLHNIPYPALPRLAHLDVQVAPSLAHWIAWRTRAARIARSAVVVGNPTLDLDFATVEARSVASTLSALEYDTRAFVETEATEEAVREAVKTAGILHFAGHGFSRPTEPLLCSLLMHPSPWQGDPMAPLAAAAETWSPTVDLARHTDTPSGRLTERYDEFAPEELVERQLDYSTYGTLWAEYYRGRLLRLAELWTTSDILIDDSLEACALAFLCACESGRADLSFEIDEAAGIPSSLEIGGVDTVICTLWPVADIAALVFSRLFYAELRLAHDTLDARAMVKTCRDRLRTMDGDAVVDLLRAMQVEMGDAIVKAHLRIAEREVLSMADRPFEHPFYWAAFTCYGVERLEME